jgi:hypothetical protein
LTDQAVGEFESLWEAAGSRVAGALDGASAVVVLGHDPIATASVALGIARAQASHRRVAVGDLIGDVAPIQDLVTDDDPHGLTDSFIYGVSLNRIARQVDASGNLHILPSGSDLVVSDEILRNARWRRLASGFQEVGALLLLVAPAAVPGVEDLVANLDGVVLVGDAENPAPNARVFAEVASAARRSPPRVSPRPAAVVPAPIPAARHPRWLIPAAAVVVIAAIVTMLARGYLTRSQPPAQVIRRESAAASDSLTGATPRVDSSPPPAVTNPADSASASPFGVQITMVDTEDGAAIRVRAGGKDFPAATFAAVNPRSDRGTWYKVMTGAYVDRAKATQLLAFLRQRGLVPQGWGAVVRAPLALQLASATDSTQAAPIIADFQSRKVPAYGLLQRDGSVRIYAGAFENADESALFKSLLKERNIDATLAYRVGRAY